MEEDGWDVNLKKKKSQRAIEEKKCHLPQPILSHAFTHTSGSVDNWQLSLGNTQRLLHCHYEGVAEGCHKVNTHISENKSVI